MAYQGTNGDDIIDAVKLGLTNIHIRGGKGNDIISPAGYAGGEGEEGNDTIIGTNQPGVSAYYGSAPSGIVANLATGKVQDGYGYQDTLVDIYNISGSRFNDQFVGSAGNDHFDGAGGSDSFVGGGGLDVVQYGSVKSTEVVLSYDVGTGITYVKKNVSGGDQGTDYLKGINSIRFSDGVTVTTVADTSYYTQKANAFPSFAQFYKWNGWTAGAGLASTNVTVIDINQDGNDDFAMHYWQGPNPSATSAPTPNQLLVFEAGVDGTFTNATSRLFGVDSPIVLPGASRKNAIGDINGDGKQDWVYANNWEDGRNTPDGASGSSQSAAIISQLDGTYKVLSVGDRNWYHSVGIVNSNSQTSVWLGGYATGTNAYRDLDGNPSGGYGYSLNAAGTGWSNYDIVPAYANTFSAISPITPNGQVKQVVVPLQAGGGLTHEVTYGLLNLDSGGQWSVASTLELFPSQKVNVVASNGMKIQREVAIANGQAMLPVGASESGQMLLYPGAVPIVVVKFSGMPITARTDGSYYEADAQEGYNWLSFVSVTGTSIGLAGVTIVGEDPAHNINFMDFIDVNKDGLHDIVTYPYRNGGAPLVYLNTGAGTFAKVDSSLFPQAPADWGNAASSKFLDANGDGKMDLVYWPSNGSRLNETINYTPQLYLGSQLTLSMENTYTSAITLTDRIHSPLIHTFAGNDTISDINATTSATKIDGGLGVDTTSYSSARSQYQVTHNISGTWAVTKNGAIADTLTNVERLQFSDTKIAIDLDGHAGTTAKILGAVFGTTSLTNKAYVGIGLSLLDGGMSYPDLMYLALNAAGATTHAATVNLLWTNIFGSAPTAAEAAPYIELLDNGTYSEGALGVLAADSILNTTHINLVGLQKTGIAFST